MKKREKCVRERRRVFTRAGGGVGEGRSWGRYSSQIGGPQNKGVGYSGHQIVCRVRRLLFLNTLRDKEREREIVISANDRVTHLLLHTLVSVTVPLSS